MSISNFQKHQALLLLLSFLFLLVVSVVGDYNKSGDSEILIQVRNSGLDDPEGSLDNWVVNSEYNACNWTGITCDDRHVSVVSIDLSGFGLSGGFPFELCRIRTLRNLSLSDNSINGSLLSSSLSLCSHLQVLNLSSNYLVGELPDFSPEFSELRVIDLSFNNFSGEIPASFCRFPKLRVLKLIENLLNGSIPAFLGNLSELTRLELAQNPFQESHLPSEIGNLSKLDNLFLPNTNLIGPIPESIGKLVSLRNLDLSSNRLSGEVPETIGGLIKVEQILLFANQISGEIPVSLANLSNLRTLDVSLNSLTGKLHEKIAAMPLEYVNLNDNFLEGEIPQVFASNPKLRSVKLFNNSFSGTLPANLGRYAELEEFDVSTNKFAGNLPEYLCYGKKLQRIVAFNNGFSGVVPESYGECISLSYIRIENNELSGKLPDSFWNLPMLEYLGLRNNGFKGSVPPSIFKARGLTVVTVSGNNFSGTLPDQLCKLRNLVKFDVGGNNFFGEIPSCITELKNLQKLDLQENNFSGIIPSTVSSWTVLTELNLSGNRLSGQIPYQLGDLPVLTYLDLSRNILSGQIPIELTKLKLNQFNVSVNKLYGRVPTGFDHELFLASLMGNLNLCSPDLKPLPPCRKPKQVALYVIITLSITALVLIGSLLWVVKSKFYVFNGKRMKPWKVAAFQRIRFNEEDIIPHLTSRNLIGEGGSGRVYRVCLKPGHVVAVKRLWSGKKEADAELVFQSEVGSLGQVRHINIVKLLCSLSDGEDNRTLVYEYMENGSLGDALHGHSDSNLLDWQTRFDIAVGTAQGLAYLHHDCVPAIVHRDIKSNNVLLDEEFRPKLADFGLAKTLQREGDPTRDAMSRVVGSYGYIAPEYAYTMKVTEKSDVYSFGVVLMEMVTGKRPNDAFFGDNGDIVKWVRGTALSCFAEENGKEEVHCSDVENLRDPRMKLFTCDFEQIERVLNVALLCTSTLPINRPSMKRVVELLKGQKL